MSNKFMAADDLEDIVARLEGCEALLWTLGAFASTDHVPEKAVHGACDLLSGILRDFKAGIDAASETGSEVTP